MQHILLCACAWLLLFYCVLRLVGAARRKSQASDLDACIISTHELKPMPMPITIDFSDDGCIPMLTHALEVAEDTHHHLYIPKVVDANVPLKEIPCQHCGMVAIHLNHLSLTKEELLS